MLSLQLADAANRCRLFAARLTMQLLVVSPVCSAAHRRMRALCGRRLLTLLIVSVRMYLTIAVATRTLQGFPAVGTQRTTSRAQCPDPLGALISRRLGATASWRLSALPTSQLSTLSIWICRRPASRSDLSAPCATARRRLALCPLPSCRRPASGSVDAQRPNLSTPCVLNLSTPCVRICRCSAPESINL